MSTTGAFERRSSYQNDPVIAKGFAAHLLLQKMLDVHLVLLRSREGAGESGQCAIALKALEVFLVQEVLRRLPAAKEEPAGSCLRQLLPQLLLPAVPAALKNGPASRSWSVC